MVGLLQIYGTKAEVWGIRNIFTHKKDFLKSHNKDFRTFLHEIFSTLLPFAQTRTTCTYYKNACLMCLIKWGIMY